MKTEHYNNLSEAELERVALLFEECSEVVQICGKIMRHGFESFNPYDVLCTTNRQLLEKEVGDVLSSIARMTDKDISGLAIDTWKVAKDNNVKPYLHHQ